MGCRHSVVHVCMHDERMVILSMNEKVQMEITITELKKTIFLNIEFLSDVFLIGVMVAW
jgi:hypothetical protein